MACVVGNDDMPRCRGIGDIQLWIFLESLSLTTSLVTIDGLPGRSIRVADLARSGPHNWTVFFVQLKNLVYVGARP